MPIKPVIPLVLAIVALAIACMAAVMAFLSYFKDDGDTVTIVQEDVPEESPAPTTGRATRVLHGVVVGEPHNEPIITATEFGTHRITIPANTFQLDGDTVHCYFAETTAMDFPFLSHSSELLYGITSVPWSDTIINQQQSTTHPSPHQTYEVYLTFDATNSVLKVSGRILTAEINAEVNPSYKDINSRMKNRTGFDGTQEVYVAVNTNALQSGGGTMVATMDQSIGIFYPA